MAHITADRLRDIVYRVFVAAGVPDGDAQTLAASLVENNLVGHDSHGVLRVTMYIRMLENGRTDVHAEPKIVRESATTALIDAKHALGQIAARRAMDMAIQKAKEHDMGMVAIMNCGHTGRLGEYTVQAARAGCVGMAYSAGTGSAVAPYLGTSRVLGTNPISWAAPATRYPAVFMDFATSEVAWGKIEATQDKGVSMPEGWLTDAEGKPITDPTRAREGALLPFGKHKGYSLGFFVELLAGGFVRAECPAFPDHVPDWPTVMSAINIEAFQDLGDFTAMVDQLIEVTKSAQKAPGVEEIFVPGEIEWRAREAHLRDGLDLPDGTWQRIVEAAEAYGVLLDE